MLFRSEGGEEGGREGQRGREEEREHISVKTPGSHPVPPPPPGGGHDDTHGSGSNMSFFFFSNWSLQIILEAERTRGGLSTADNRSMKPTKGTAELGLIRTLNMLLETIQTPSSGAFFVSFIFDLLFIRKTLLSTFKTVTITGPMGCSRKNGSPTHPPLRTRLQLLTQPPPAEPG